MHGSMFGRAHKCARCRADGDIMVVRELRKLSNEARRATRIAARTADESLKWLEWSQFLTARPLLMRACHGDVHRPLASLL